MSILTSRSFVLQPHRLRRHHASLSVQTSLRLQCRAALNDSVADEPTSLLRPDQLKSSLREALEDVNRGIFGVPVAQKAAIEGWISLLEDHNPISNPTEHLQMVEGEWRLLYSTISILGLKRTKLGLRDFITLGDFLQTLDVKKNRAANTIMFSVAGLGMLSGALTIEASYVVSSATRVDIKFQSSTIVPTQLLKLFQKNYDMLLSIFNPEGWLEITYVDDEMRVGRDDKGNIFLGRLEVNGCGVWDYQAVQPVPIFRCLKLSEVRSIVPKAHLVFITLV
ncbi:hypothetical protein GOP47_0021578 [Adiantum capillus-veneris]|uniref:Plastid lipid-associated protein/fibrillin conserved domain-containing protein n=1 Tax=Adiantum capillus-veneris TaxID=13818 RepID=A0A9D4U9W4_ADICA|nr:hypothetical protein GOP47_0021578 [Adiantum capillus-veneris]